MGSCPFCSAPVDSAVCAYCGSVLAEREPPVPAPPPRPSPAPPSVPQRPSTLSPMEERQMTQGLWGTVAKGALGLTCCCSLVVLGVLTLLALGLYAIFF